MNIKKEWRALLLIVGGFFLFYFLPVGWDKFNTAVISSLELARWYAREHVILCLLTAFFIAGAIAVFLNEKTVIKYLGAEANKVVAYGVASVSGSILAVCSCTVLPLFNGIYRMGAGLGPAVSFLYSGPAINVLAIVLTARILGWQLGVARALGAVIFSIVIGLLMHFIFIKDEIENKRKAQLVEDEGEGRPLWQTVIYFAGMVGVLVFANWGKPQQVEGIWHLIYACKWWLTAGFALLVGASLVAWFKLALWKFLLGIIIVGMTAFYFPDYPQLAFGIGAVYLAVSIYSSNEELEKWLGESWGFARQILPLLLGGVLVAGIFFGLPGGKGGLIPHRWVAGLVGGNSLFANFIAAISGALMYFATLTEVPILKGLLDSGMGYGPALALLLAGPAVSLPNLLVIHSVLGTRKTSVYFVLVVIMSTVAGWIYGAWLV
ncbi:MAG: permease [bacterium]